MQKKSETKAGPSKRCPKNQASADWARAQPGAGMQPILNPKFIKIVKRLYLKFFALYILLAPSVFILPENIGDNAACAGLVSLMKQLFKCRYGRDWLMRRICGALLSCDVGG